MILNAHAISPRFKSRVQQLNLIFENDIFSELYNGPTKPNKWNKMYSKYPFYELVWRVYFFLKCFDKMPDLPTIFPTNDR